MWVWIHYMFPKPFEGMITCNNFSNFNNLTNVDDKTPQYCVVAEIASYCLLLCLAWVKPSLVTHHCQHINHYTNIYQCLLGLVLGMSHIHTKASYFFIKFPIFTVCLRGTKVHKKCYLASEGLKHYHEANEDCISKGGTLVVPRNSDEINVLRDYSKKSLPGVNDFWLGINDMVTEGKFLDVHGFAVSFLNWDRAQPSGGKRENCVLFSQSAQGKWSDEACRSSKRYICEFIIP